MVMVPPVTVNCSSILPSAASNLTSPLASGVNTTISRFRTGLGFTRKVLDGLGIMPEQVAGSVYLKVTAWQSGLVMVSVCSEPNVALEKFATNLI